jgi:hypothetical protein
LQSWFNRTTADSSCHSFTTSQIVDTNSESHSNASNRRAIEHNNVEFGSRLRREEESAPFWTNPESREGERREQENRTEIKGIEQDEISESSRIQIEQGHKREQ